MVRSETRSWKKESTVPVSTSAMISFKSRIYEETTYAGLVEVCTISQL